MTNTTKVNDATDQPKTAAKDKPASGAKSRSQQRSAAARAELGKLPKQLVEVAKLKGKALIDRYTEVMGEAPKSKNQHFLRRRISVELQCRATGRPTAEEKVRIKDVQAYALKKGLWKDIRTADSETKAAPPPPAAKPAAARPAVDPRLPAVGTVIERKHSNTTHKVTVLPDGFEYKGHTYGSLSKVAREITGTTWNGFLFFNLVERKKA